jgi:hypothetical protein
MSLSDLLWQKIDLINEERLDHQIEAKSGVPKISDSPRVSVVDKFT